MDYYDIALQGCGVDKGLESALGFKKVFLAGRDVALTGKKGNFSGAIATGSDKPVLEEAARSGARALIIEGMRTDRSLIDIMAKRNTVLCIPMSAITSKEGMERSRAIFMARGLFSSARRRRLHVGFVSLAGSREGLCSAMQLIEFAKLVGADEQYAAYSISEVNRAIANGDED